MRGFITALACIGVVAMAGCGGGGDGSRFCESFYRPTEAPDILLGFGVVCDWGGTCFDSNGEEHPCICRGEHECGQGYTCLRGPGGHCICQPYGSQANPAYADPNCLNVVTD